MIGIEIKNFQAIDDLTLKVEGFTALVGRSNIGKSSIVRALRCALSGSSGSEFVRHDARVCPRIVDGAKSCKCFASVKLTFGPGQALLWEKGGRGMNRYTVWRDGVEAVYDRVGQSAELPEFLDAQFAPAKLGPNASLLQVSSQFEAPFLLDLSGPAVAGILSDVGQLDEINQALTAVAKDRRADVATRKVRETDLTGLRERLVPYEQLDDHLQRVRALQEQGRTVAACDQRLRLAERLIREVTESAQILRRVSAVAEQKPPDIRPLQTTATRLEKAHAFLEGWDRRRETVQALRAALAPPLPTPERLLEVFRRKNQARSLEASLTERAGRVAQLEALTAVAVPSGLARIQEMARSLKSVGQWLSELVELRDAHVKGTGLQSLTVPELPAFAQLSRRLADAGRLAAQLEGVERAVAETEHALEQVTGELDAVQADFAALGVCPTCHQGIAPEHVAHV